MPKLLVVDDDPWQNDAVRDWFLMEGHTVDQAFSAIDMRTNLSVASYDLIVLDWQLPDGEGPLLVAELRKNGSTVPIIMLTGKQTVDDKEFGFRSGADDYLTKPFQPRELSARVTALLRRTRYVDTKFTVGDLLMDQETKSASVANQPITLTKTEFDVLLLLAKSPSKIFSSDLILQRVWESDSESTADIIRKYIQRLRSKLESKSALVTIKTHHGTGYSLEPPPTATP